MARKARPRRTALDDRLLKGNISADGERIFHSPSQEHYDRIGISTAKGEHWSRGGQGQGSGMAGGEAVGRRYLGRREALPDVTGEMSGPGIDV